MGKGALELVGAQYDKALNYGNHQIFSELLPIQPSYFFKEYNF